MSRGRERKDHFYNDEAEKEVCRSLESLSTSKRTSERSCAGDVGQKNLIRE